MLSHTSTEYLDLSATLQGNAETLQEVLDLLIDRPGSLVPFIGAGASIPYGMPGWTGFLHYLLDFASRDKILTPSSLKSIGRLLQSGRLELAAACLYTELGAPRFQTALQATFRVAQPSSSRVLQHAISLADGLVITTNYDRLVEDTWQSLLALSGVNREIHRLLPTSSEDLERALRGPGLAVLKLHGDVEKPETWVLTGDRYNAMYETASFSHFLSSFLSSHVPLFIGCSMTEDRLLTAMRSHHCVGYAILATPQSVAEQRRVTLRLKDCVRIIWLKADTTGNPVSPYRILEPLLFWLSVNRRAGSVAWDADYHPDAAWSRILLALETDGQLEQGLRWIREHWVEWQSRELAAEYLRLADLAGRPAEWQTYLETLRPDGQRVVASITQHALDYFYGRLLGQSGHWPAAVSRHASNRPRPPRTDRYQVMSWFEEGQLRFRTEEFEQAGVVFGEVYQLLLGRPSHRPCLVDVLKFMATLQVLDTIYDHPGSAGLWPAGESDPLLALHLATLGVDEAVDCHYSDGHAWSLCVTAFAFEALQRRAEAAARFSKAFAIADAGRCRAATRLHILLYQSAFFRRSGDLDAAADSLKTAVPDPDILQRGPDRRCFFEQHLLLARARGESDAVSRYLAPILDAHSESALLLDGSTRLERRLQRLRHNPEMVLRP